jgi:hypothetical protein
MAFYGKLIDNTTELQLVEGDGQYEFNKVELDSYVLSLEGGADKLTELNNRLATAVDDNTPVAWVVQTWLGEL